MSLFTPIVIDLDPPRKKSTLKLMVKKTGNGKPLKMAGGSGKASGKAGGDAGKGKGFKDWALIPLKWNRTSFDDLVKRFCLLEEFGAVFPADDATAAEDPGGMIALYVASFINGNLRLPATRFLGAVLKCFGIHVSQTHPLGLCRLTHFEFLCKANNIEPTPRNFHYFYKMLAKDSWYSFALRSDVPKFCTGTFRSLYDWETKFFYVNASAIPLRMTLRDTAQVVVDLPRMKDPSLSQWLFDALFL